MKTSLLPTRVAAAAALLLSVTGALAADFTVSGQITSHKDIVSIDMSVTSPATNVSLWTDSWMAGLNFDPIAALWVANGADYTRVSEVDDDDTLAAGQGFYDTGMQFANLAAGQYRVTLAASPNAANGTLLSQGFAHDSQAAILLTAWTQPSYDPNANDQKGGFWRVSFSNVDSVSVVPEPASLVLMALGLAGLATRARRLQA